MLRTVTIVPAVLTNNKQDYRAQLERINMYTKHIQVDVTDGKFATNETLDITNLWWPQGWTVDLHLMVEQPSFYMDTVFKLHPALCIFHAEAKENLLPIFEMLHAQGIKAGVALLKTTYPGRVKQYIEAADHVLIFAGDLGRQGGAADMMQMEKIKIIRGMKPEVEIGTYVLSPRVKAIVSVYTTKEVNEKGYEAHKEYIDIQYLVSGVEKIGFVSLEYLKETKSYNVEKDIAFYDERGVEPQDLLLGNGYFAILYPQDGHMPQLWVNGPVQVKKVVIKVKI